MLLLTRVALWDVCNGVCTGTVLARYIFDMNLERQIDNRLIIAPSIAQFHCPLTACNFTPQSAVH